MPIINGTYRTIDVIEEAVLHDARAAELRQSRSRGTAQIMNRPRHLYWIGPRFMLGFLARLVLRESEGFLPHMLFADWRWKNEDAVQLSARLQ